MSHSVGSFVDLPAYELAEHERVFFHSFGFLRVRGLFKDQIDLITDRFEAVFDDEMESGNIWELGGRLEAYEPRRTVPSLLEKDPATADLPHSPRLRGVIEGVMGPDYEYTNSDGNLMYCSTTWHPDTYGSPLTRFHVKCCMYLDPLTAENGAIRVIPGTHFWDEQFATRLRSIFHQTEDVEEIFGMPAEELPGYTIESEPGDLIIWSYRTLHATFHGQERRRLISLGFRETGPEFDD